jgi:tetratricopeptide (TPR) repeat protein
MRFRILRGYATEGRNNLRAVLALPTMQEPHVARAHTLYAGGALAAYQSDHAEALKMLTECLAIRRGLDNPRETAGALSALSTLHVRQGDMAKARECQEEALSIFREAGDRLGEAIGLQNLGEISLQQGDDAGAKELFEQCLALVRSIKHQELESECERSLGELALAAGNVQDAQARFSRALEVCRDAEDKRGEAITLACLGRNDRVRGDYESARKKLAEALRTFEAFEMNSEALDCLEDYTELLHAGGRFEDAVRLHAATDAIRMALTLPRSPRREVGRQETLGAARAALGEAPFDAAWAAGHAWAFDDAIERALATAEAPAVTV